jgi:hypothetical protein
LAVSTLLQRQSTTDIYVVLEDFNIAEAHRLERIFEIHLDIDSEKWKKDKVFEWDFFKEEIVKAMSASWVRAFRADLEASKEMRENSANEVTPSVQQGSTLEQDSTVELRRLQPRYRQHSGDFRAFSTKEEWGLSPTPVSLPSSAFPRCEGSKVTANNVSSLMHGHFLIRLEMHLPNSVV